MSTEPITQALGRLELAGSYHRAAQARHMGVPQIELSALEHLEAVGGLTPGELGHRLGLTSGGVTALTGRLTVAEAELVTQVLDELAARREEAAAATPGPERVYPADGYSRALLM